MAKISDLKLAYQVFMKAYPYRRVDWRPGARLNPTVGKQLFEQDHGVGLYVPLRVFVYTDAAGKTFVSYDRPSAILAQFRNEKIGMVAQMLDQKLDGLANMAAH